MELAKKHPELGMKLLLVSLNLIQRSRTRSSSRSSWSRSRSRSPLGERMVRGDGDDEERGE